MRSVMMVIVMAAVFGATSGARAAYITPGDNTVVDFQPNKYGFGDSFAKARTATSSHNGYSVIASKWQTSSSYSPSIGFIVFANTVENDYAVYLSAQHGVVEAATSIPLLGMEHYPDDTNGMNAAIAKVTYYQGYFGFAPADMKVFHVPGYAWVIGITDDVIYDFVNYTTYDLALVYVATCESYKIRSGFDAAAFAGYDNSPLNSTALAEADSVWSRMDGSRGLSGRTMSSAIAGTNLSCDPWTSEMVLAPAISDFGYADASSSGFITFDTEMDQLTNCDYILSASGAISLVTPYWSGNQINYDVVCNYEGTGSVTVSNYYATSAYGLKLNPDGYGSNSETYKVGYSCAGGINPAADIDHFVAIYTGGAVHLRWKTDREHNTASFQVRRIASDGTGTLLPEVPAHGPGDYDVADPTGTFADRYQLVEHQTGGLRDLTYGPQSVRPEFTVVTSEPITYDPAEIEATVNAIPEPMMFGPESTGMYDLAIFCPDSTAFIATANQHKNLWIARGHTATVIPVPVGTAARDQIKAEIASMYNVALRHVILIGDASDDVEYDNPVNWPDTNWVKKNWPAQPQNNLLPTFYVRENAVSPSTSMSYFTRYFSTDDPYVDVDNDGRPDLIIGRVSVHNNTEYQAYVAKLTIHLNTLPSASHANKASLFVYAVDFGTVPGDHIGAKADELATHFPPTVTLSKMIDRNGPPTTWTTLELDSIYKAHWNAGRSVVNILSTNASRSNNAFTALQWGFSMSQLTANDKFPVFIGASCGIGNFNQREDPTLGRPLCERHLLEPHKGAIAWVGPSRGTFQEGNVEINRRLLDAIYGLQAKNIGTAVLEMKRGMLMSSPQYTNLVRSYGLLGDPLVAPIGAPAITAVGGAPAAPRVGLGSPRPNPFNPVTSLTVYLAVKSQAHLAVYDVHGRLVRTLSDKPLPAGPTTFTWNGTDDSGRPTASGVYFARLTAPAVAQTHKLVLLK